MKNINKNFKKIYKESIKMAMTITVFVFFAMSMLFQKDTQATQLQFVRNSDETATHNAANQRDYLFQNEAGNPEYQ
ncbi:MAG: hypothetical protein WCH65_04955 [bacterium]